MSHCPYALICFQSADFFTVSTVEDCIGQIYTSSFVVDLCGDHKQPPTLQANLFGIILSSQFLHIRRAEQLISVSSLSW